MATVSALDATETGGVLDTVDAAAGGLLTADVGPEPTDGHHRARYQGHVLNLVDRFLLAALTPAANLASVPLHVVEHNFVLIR